MARKKIALIGAGQLADRSAGDAHVGARGTAASAHAEQIYEPSDSLFVPNRPTGDGNERFDHLSQHGEDFRAFDGEAGRGGHPTARLPA